MNVYTVFARHGSAPGQVDASDLEDVFTVCRLLCGEEPLQQGTMGIEAVMGG